MSYDFLLMPREAGQSWDELLDANEQQRVLDEGDRPLSPAARSRLERIADRLQAHDPQLERFTTERHIELSRGDEGIQVSLFSGELAIAVAYWHTGPTARAVMQVLWSYLAIMEQETGWEVYDPQLDRSLDRARDLDEVTSGYAAMSARLHKMFPEALRHPDRSGRRDRH